MASDDVLRPTGEGAGEASSQSGLYDQWRQHLAQRPAIERAGPFRITLPSGMGVVARRPHLIHLLQTGRIPDALTPMVHDLIAKSQRAEGAQQGSGDAAIRAELVRRRDTDPVKFALEWRAFLEAVWLSAVIVPNFAQASRMSKLPADHLDVADVDVVDLEYLFVWSQGVDQSVQDFLRRRAREAEALGASPVGEGVRPGSGGPDGGKST